ncbi:MAG: HAD-IA family hydrolase [Armatimonadota bacterium]|nr:HAD-IA family hydrolase [Armatimonadota bacterium]MDR7485728.1 HAD-IA family hydrolase [Armatimonadota bacterium]MDR7534155.1 HAD-IA family hydrolase [Armatimonadota bacterium]MDR7536392.1 HAD-IA family hydrolase [Armatimonadota bacterium]
MPLRAVTFDVYSALYDITTGLAGAVGDLYRHRGLAGDPISVARSWRQKHMEYLLIANSLEREPASNRRAIEASARWAVRALQPPIGADELAALVAAWTRLPPWPEAVEVLQAVRRRPLVLATLSNGDEAMQRDLLATLPVAFDVVISTEGGKFKPHPSVYARALARLGVDAGVVLHVAGSPTDAMGATAAGIRTVWVNRAGDAVLDPRFAPAWEVADLRGIPPLLDRQA